jgi:hypothetical protein
VGTLWLLVAAAGALAGAFALVEALFLLRTCAAVGAGATADVWELFRFWRAI